MLVVNDPHCADRPPLGRVPGYREQILDKLIEVGFLCEEYSVSFVVVMGDLFHAKRPTHTSHYLIQRLQEIFAAYPCPIFFLPGNHDLGPDGLASIDRQPLGDLRRSGTILDHSGVWDTPGSPVLVARPYDRERDADPTYYALTEEERAEITRQQDRPVLMVSHGSIIGPGQDRPYPHVTADQIDMTGIDVHAGSHIHEDVGLHLLDTPKVFFNYGSIGRTARTQENMARTVQVGLITFGEVSTVEPIPLNPLKSALPAKEVFIESVLATDHETSDEIVDFAEALARGLQVETAPIDELLSEMPEFAGVSKDDVRTRVKQYLEEEE